MISQHEREMVEKAKRIIQHSIDLDDTRKNIEQATRELELDRAAVEKSHADLDTLREEIHKITQEKAIAFPWLAGRYAKYFELCDLKLEEYLRKKVRPADKKADKVKELATECRELRSRTLIAESARDYYESLFPWLTDYIDDNIDDSDLESISNKDKSYKSDPVSRWLTDAQFKNLPENERNQLALDRYINRKMSNWAIGREYERYVGQLHESRGYRVKYVGATDGKSDLGRDLIATKSNETKIIQCKYWSIHKTIHEKHLFQLYGTTIGFWIDKFESQTDGGLFSSRSLSRDSLRETNVIPMFTTSTKLSDVAMRFADTLGIKVEQNFAFDRNYPRIKCNISSAGNKIYHLPMDQQYDKVVIEPEKGEFYATTVDEAVNAKFRRAWRWKGNSSDSN